MQVHACLLALHTGRPVKIVYDREESFYGHVHRHPARMRYEHGATRDGQARLRAGADRARRRRLRVQLDRGGLERGAASPVGPYEVPQRRHRRLRRLHEQPALRRDARLRRGAGRLRARVADGQAGRRARHGPGRAADHATRCARATALPTGQVVARPGAGRRDARARCATCRLPAGPRGPGRDLRELPGGVSNTTHGEGVARGVGYAVAFKNVGFSEGFDDYSTARVRLCVDDGEPLVEVHTAAAEVGQGLVTVQAQIARTELGVERVRVLNRRHPGRLGRLDVGLAPDLHDGRRGEDGLRGGARGARRARSAADEAGGAVARWPSCVGDDPIEETLEFHHRAHLPAGPDRPGRFATSSSPSPRIAPWSTWTRSWASCGWWSWPPPRTSARS